MAAQAFYVDEASAIDDYGPIAYWGVSSITDMAELFKDMSNFNADLSFWSTSSVTSMNGMFEVRSARASTPPPWIHPARFLLAPRHTPLPSPGPHAPFPHP